MGNPNDPVPKAKKRQAKQKPIREYIQTTKPTNRFQVLTEVSTAKVNYRASQKSTTEATKNFQLLNGAAENNYTLKTSARKECQQP